MKNIPFVMLASLIALISAQLIKPFTLYFAKGKFSFRNIFASGGLPSSHTSTVGALSLSCGLSEGFDSLYFTIVLILSIIIAYDAMNVRYYAGQNIKLTKQLVEDLKDETVISLTLDDPVYSNRLKDVLGHKKIEVFIGAVWGILIASILYLLYY